MLKTKSQYLFNIYIYLFLRGGWVCVGGGGGVEGDSLGSCCHLRRCAAREFAQSRTLIVPSLVFLKWNVPAAYHSLTLFHLFSPVTRMSGTWQRAPLKAWRRTLLLVEKALRRNQRSPIFFFYCSRRLPCLHQKSSPSVLSAQPPLSPTTLYQARKLSRVSVFFPPDSFFFCCFFFLLPLWPWALPLTLDVQRHHLLARASLVLCLTGQIVEVVFSRNVGQVQDQHQRGAQDDLLQQGGWGKRTHTRARTHTHAHS